MAQIELYDTTLRDGAQGEGISLSVDDKLKIARKLDDLGVNYIEGGWPGSNPKDIEFFAQVPSLQLSNATIAAFGSTRRANIPAEKDANLQALLDSGTSVLTLVGKSWDLHVTRLLETSLEENLSMISDSISFLKAKGRRVFFDAEHFFDGFKANSAYALQSVKSASQAGAECIILCDTNGGALPNEIFDIVSKVKEATQVPLGIHTHNDADVAVASTIAAIEAGVRQVQGTINGYGERCGNANLISVIGNLKLKLGIDCVTEQQLGKLTEVALYVSEVANMPPYGFQPYVGASAFSHKGGLHASGVAKVQESYQHVPPERVGNIKRVVVSELSGRSNILYKLREIGMDGIVSREQVPKILDLIKVQENKGFQYEGAEASFELLVRRTLSDYRSPFELVDFMVVIEKHRRSSAEGNGELLSEATVKVRVDSQIVHTAAEGNGPVNALDDALRKALLQFYPKLEVIRLVDYKVRVVDQGAGTGSMVRVLIESTDGENTWRTVSSSANIIEASWMALVDSLEYWLIKHEAPAASGFKGDPKTP